MVNSKSIDGSRHRQLCELLLLKSSYINMLNSKSPRSCCFLTHQFKDLVRIKTFSPRSGSVPGTLKETLYLYPYMIQMYKLRLHSYPTYLRVSLIDFAGSYFWVDVHTIGFKAMHYLVSPTIQRSNIFEADLSHMSCSKKREPTGNILDASENTKASLWYLYHFTQPWERLIQNTFPSKVYREYRWRFPLRNLNFKFLGPRS